MSYRQITGDRPEGAPERATAYFVLSTGEKVFINEEYFTFADKPDCIGLRIEWLQKPFGVVFYQVVDGNLIRPKCFATEGFVPA